jgi:hypothetical protein
MGSKPLMSDTKWRKIAPLLPANRRDRQVIEAILFREHSGWSLTDTAALFGLTRVRLYQWHTAIAADLPRILAVLGLEPADQLMRRRGGRAFYRDDAEMADAIAAIKLRNFAEALRAGRR